MEKVKKPYKHFLDERIENFIPDFRNVLRDIYDVLMDLKDDSDGISNFCIKLVSYRNYEENSLYEIKCGERKIVDISDVKGRCQSMSTPNFHIKISFDFNEEASKLEIDNLLIAIGLIKSLSDMVDMKSHTIYRPTRSFPHKLPRREEIKYGYGIHKSEVTLRSNYKRDRQSEINFE